MLMLRVPLLPPLVQWDTFESRTFPPHSHSIDPTRWGWTEYSHSWGDIHRAIPHRRAGWSCEGSVEDRELQNQMGGANKAAFFFAPIRGGPTSMFWGANNLTSFDSLYREKAELFRN